jgi:NAD(P)-dependent dehydrogenase (short-subunit alcohol dehydrogenase family)
MFKFDNKVVLITGAAQGFGRVCAAFAERVAKLSLCDINDERGQETLRSVRDRSPFAERAGAPMRALTHGSDNVVLERVPVFISAQCARLSAAQSQSTI